MATPHRPIHHQRWYTGGDSYHAGSKRPMDNCPPSRRLFLVAKTLYYEDLFPALQYLAGLVDLDVNLRPDGVPKGFAFVTFDSTPNATRAMTAINAMVVNGVQLVAVYAEELRNPKRARIEDAYSHQPPLRGPYTALAAVPTGGKGFAAGVGPKARAQVDDHPPTQRLFIIGRNLRQDALGPVLEQMPGFQDLDIKVNWEGQTKGYAYATFASVADATVALNVLNGLDVDGVTLKVVFAAEPGTAPPAVPGHFHALPYINGAEAPRPKTVDDDSPPSTRLFLVGRNLYPDMVHSLLAGFPGLIKTDVKLTPTGGTKGYAYAYFSTVEEATAAMNVLHGIDLGEGTLKVVYAREPNNPTLLTPVVPSPSPQQPRAPAFQPAAVRTTPAPSAALEAASQALHVEVNDDVPREPPPGVDPADPPGCLVMYVLGPGCTILEDNLISLFRRYSGLEYFQPGPKPSRHGFVKYDNPTSAAVALRDLHLKPLHAGVLKVLWPAAPEGVAAATTATQ